MPRPEDSIYGLRKSGRYVAAPGNYAQSLSKKVAQAKVILVAFRYHANFL
jgi:hypothetical protein